MLKKIIIGILLISVVGAAGAAIANQIAARDNGIVSASSGSGVLAEDSTLPNGSGVLAQENNGVPWQAAGTIAELDSLGMTLDLDNGESIYVELGPSDYWQNQSAELQSGIRVSLIGTENEGQYHAYQVTLADNQVLALRTEQGQPLWSGGATNRQGQNAGQNDGTHSPEPQAQVDEWVTISGTLMAFQNGNMTISTPEGKLLTFQTGQPRFFAEQGVVFQVGDEVVAVGFYTDTQFTAGEVTQVSTGLRVMLRDPNGRPLWAGPGNGNGNGGQSGG